jgi:hypothetical protein
MRKIKSNIILLSLIAMCNSVLGQEVKINSNFVVEADGTFRMDNAASTWDDLMVFPDATTKGNSNSPVWTKFGANGASQGVFLWAFDPTIEQELYFTIQIPHSYKLGSTLQPHVHWTTFSGTPSGTNVVWGLEYTMMKVGGTFSTTTTLLTANTVIPSIGTPTGVGQHLITEFSGITSGTSPNDIGISTILMCRLFRKAADSNDTFAYPVGLLGFDIHYEKDTQGSREEYVK